MDAGAGKWTTSWFAGPRRWLNSGKRGMENEETQIRLQGGRHQPSRAPWCRTPEHLVVTTHWLRTGGASPIARYNSGLHRMGDPLPGIAHNPADRAIFSNGQLNFKEVETLNRQHLRGNRGESTGRGSWNGANGH
jgi:hypothetical protein